MAQHPLKNSIVERYLKFRPGLTRDALARLQETPEDPETVTLEADQAEEQLEKPIRLHDQRLDRVTQLLKESGYNHVVDMGCGTGKLSLRHDHRAERLLKQSPCPVMGLCNFSRLRSFPRRTLSP